jgi:hypothetical protein
MTEHASVDHSKAIVDPGAILGPSRGLPGAKACPGCANPHGSTPVPGCRQCAVRELARGPHFFRSMMTGKLTVRYQAALMRLGPDIAKTHEEVKAAAKTITMGSTPA